MIYVLAGSCREFDECIHDHYKKGDRGIEYLSSARQLCGVINPIVLRYGTWYKRHDLREIEDMIHSRLIDVAGRLIDISRYTDAIARIEALNEVIVSRTIEKALTKYDVILCV